MGLVDGDSVVKVYAQVILPAVALRRSSYSPYAMVWVCRRGANVLVQAESSLHRRGCDWEHTRLGLSLSWAGRWVGGARLIARVGEVGLNLWIRQANRRRNYSSVHTYLTEYTPLLCVFPRFVMGASCSERESCTCWLRSLQDRGSRTIVSVVDELATTWRGLWHV